MTARFRPAPVLGFVLIALVLVLGLVGCGGEDESLTPGARIVSEAQLKKEAKSVGYPIYWVGPRAGVDYEYTTRSDGRIYVRYLPKGATPGTKKEFLTVGTYPMPDAYKVVTSISQKPGSISPPITNGVAGATTNKPESVFVAFRGKDLQIEVFDPDASTALEAASSGDLEPVK